MLGGWFQWNLSHSLSSLVMVIKWEIFHLFSTLNSLNYGKYHLDPGGASEVWASL